MSDGEHEDSVEDDPSIDSLLREAGRIAPVQLEPDRIGAQLARYRIDAKLGEGAMGIVYAAEDRELGRRVALKVLPRRAMEDVERRRRFVREARTAAAVSHRNLVAVYDVGEADDTVFIAMELVKGEPLRSRIAEAPSGMATAEALRIAAQIARGLGAAHSSGVVHRDLKPENVMLDAEGTAKVVDFGLAKLQAPSGGAELSTQDGKILGTPSYMAPEQAKGARVGPTADVFSLGVVLYEMLTGQRPFKGATTVDVLVKIARDAPPPPSQLARGVSRELDRVVLRCLEKDPQARYRDGDAAALALESVSTRASHGRSRLAWMLALGGAATIGVLAFGLGHRAPERGGAGAPEQSVRGAVPPPSADLAPVEPTAAASAPPAASPSALVAASPPSATASTALRPMVARSAAALPTSPVTSSAAAAGAAPRASVDPLARQK